MPLETRSKTIDGFEYTVAQLDAYTAVDLFNRCIKVLSPAIAKAESLEGLVAEGTTGIGDAFLKMLASAAQSLDTADLKWAITTCAKATTVNLGGQTPQLERVVQDHFAGRIASLFKWLAFCLEVNFGDFLGVLRAATTRAKQSKEQPASAAPAAS